MIGSLALLVIVIGALCWIVGAKRLALRCLVVGIALAFIGALLQDFVADLSVFAEDHAAVFGLLLGGIVVVAAYLRFRKRRRRLDHWFDPEPVSVKRRVEREL